MRVDRYDASTLLCRLEFASELVCFDSAEQKKTILSYFLTLKYTELSKLLSHRFTAPCTTSLDICGGVALVSLSIPTQSNRMAFAFICINSVPKRENQSELLASNAAFGAKLLGVRSEFQIFGKFERLEGADVDSITTFIISNNEDNIMKYQFQINITYLPQILVPTSHAHRGGISSTVLRLMIIVELFARILFEKNP